MDCDAGVERVDAGGIGVAAGGQPLGQVPGRVGDVVPADRAQRNVTSSPCRVSVVDDSEPPASVTTAWRIGRGRVENHRERDLAGGQALRRAHAERWRPASLGVPGAQGRDDRERGPVDRRRLVAARGRLDPAGAQVDVQGQLAAPRRRLVVRVAARDCLAVGVVGAALVALRVERAGQVEPRRAPARAGPDRVLEVADGPRQVARRLAGEVMAEPVVRGGDDHRRPAGERGAGRLGDGLGVAPEPDQRVDQVRQHVGRRRILAACLVEVPDGGLEVGDGRVGAAQIQPARLWALG